MHALTLLFRLLHIVSAVLWVGGAAVLALFIIPAVFMSGPSGAQFMQTVTQRTKLVKYIPSVGGLAVLSGLALFWRDMMVGGASFARSTMGMTLSLGGLAGLVGLVVGSIMTTRSAKELASIGATVARTGGAPTAEQAQRTGMLQGRMRSGSKISLALLLIGAAAMAVARYL